MCSRRQHHSHWAILAALLSVWMNLTSGMINIQLIPQYPVIRESVTLSVTGVTGSILSVKWFKGLSARAGDQILTYIPGVTPPLVTGPLYFPRARPLSNGSLLISDLHITDSGDYTVQIQTEKAQEQANVTLTVYERVRKPKVTASTSQPKESDTYTLTCDTSNAERILWSRKSAGLPSGTSLSADNRTVTFSSVTRADSGEYRCEAENPVSKSVSDPYTVTVSYGPEKVQITGKLYVNFGSDISLSCSADSVPPPEYRWRYKDSDLSINQKSLLIPNASSENQGDYTCVVTNPVTLRTATASVYVNVTTVPVSSNNNVLEKGHIIGIVVACLLLVALVGAMFYLFMIHKQRKKSSDKNSLTNSPSINGHSTMEQPELQYASIAFNPNMPRKQQEEPETQYAPIKIQKRTPGKQQEQPELLYADIDLSKTVPRRQQQPPDSVYENRGARGAPAPENTVYSELRLH